MFESADLVEYKAEVNQRLDKLEEMIKVAIPQPESEELQNMVNKRLDSVGCADIPAKEICSMKDLKMLMSYAKQDECSAIRYACVIGFANGRKYSD